VRAPGRGELRFGGVSPAFILSHGGLVQIDKAPQDAHSVGGVVRCLLGYVVERHV